MRFLFRVEVEEESCLGEEKDGVDGNRSDEFVVRMFEEDYIEEGLKECPHQSWMQRKVLRREEMAERVFAKIKFESDYAQVALRRETKVLYYLYGSSYCTRVAL